MRMKTMLFLLLAIPFFAVAQHGLSDADRLNEMQLQQHGQNRANSELPNDPTLHLCRNIGGAGTLENQSCRQKANIVLDGVQLVSVKGCAASVEAFDFCRSILNQGRVKISELSEVQYLGIDRTWNDPRFEGYAKLKNGEVRFVDAHIFRPVKVPLDW